MVNHTGLGLYEYMLLADELGAEPIYVVNNGISHQQSTPVGQLAPFLNETLEALEFLTHPSHTQWGRVRAEMGREEPWEIKYLAVGNEVTPPPLHMKSSSCAQPSQNPLQSCIPRCV